MKIALNNKITVQAVCLVQGENKATTIDFVVPKNHMGCELLPLNWQVRAKNQKTATFMLDTLQKAEVQGDEFHLLWQVSEHFTQQDGKLLVTLVGISEQKDGVLAKFLLEGIEVATSGDGEEAMQGKGYVEAMLYRLEESMEESAKSVQAAALEAQKAASSETAAQKSADAAAASAASFLQKEEEAKKSADAAAESAKKAAESVKTAAESAKTAADNSRIAIEKHDKHVLTDLPAMLAALLPIGIILPWGGATAPNAQFLLVQGQAVSRTAYPVLYSILGTRYGAGDGSTSFNLPNLKDVMIMGAGGAYALAAKGGAASHTLTVDQLPQHEHPVVATTKANKVQKNFGVYLTNMGPGAGWQSLSGYDDTSAYEPLKADAVGKNQAHNNLPPYIALNFIIRAK